MSNASIIPAPSLDGTLAASARQNAGLSGGLNFDGYTLGQRVTAFTGSTQRPGTGPASYWIRFLVGVRTGVTTYVLNHTATDASLGSVNIAGFRISSTGALIFDWTPSSGGSTTIQLAGFVSAYSGQVVDLVATRSGSTINLYVNGALVGTATNAAVANSMDSDVIKMGAANSSNVLPFDMTAYRCAYLNRALSESDIFTIISRGVTAGDQSASQASITAGPLVIGNRYRISSFVAGDDFSNIGATNATGNEFIATGTTPTTWTNGSTLVSIGAIVAFDFETGIGFQLHDRFANRIHGALAGSVTPQWTMPRREGVLYATGTFASGTAQRLTPAAISGLVADALPARALIHEVVVNVTSGTPTTVSLGTLSTATTDIVNAQAVASGRNAEPMASRFQAASTSQLWATFNAATTATFTIPYTLTQ